MILRALAFVATFLLSACGGGSGDAPARILFISDSLGSGEIDPRAGNGTHLVPRPAEYMQQLLGPKYRVESRATAGLRVAQIESLRSIDVDAIVIWVGGADAATDTPLAEFEHDLAWLVADIPDQVDVYLVGLPFLPDPYEPRVTQFDLVIRRTAPSVGAKYIDLRTVPKGGFADQIHPDQQYSGALVRRIVQEL
jgi:hypothetical protein